MKMSNLTNQEIEALFTLCMLPIIEQFVKCEFCGIFITKYNFVYHYYQHMKYQPFECKKCLKKYYCPGNLRRHQTIHRH